MGALLVCPECAHEWSPTDVTDEHCEVTVVTYSAGDILADGDTVAIVKGHKAKGATKSIKTGTKFPNIRVVDVTNDHVIDARLPEFGQMLLKSSVVKKFIDDVSPLCLARFCHLDASNICASENGHSQPFSRLLFERG